MEGDAATLRQLHDGERATLQITQPQRYLDPAWRLMASLEASLGCLVGANAYLTPAGEWQGEEGMGTGVECCWGVMGCA
jgi:hypothetical protein